MTRKLFLKVAAGRYNVGARNTQSFINHSSFSFPSYFIIGFCIQHHVGVNLVVTCLYSARPPHGFYSRDALFFFFASFSTPIFFETVVDGNVPNKTFFSRFLRGLAYINDENIRRSDRNIHVVVAWNFIEPKWRVLLNRDIKLFFFLHFIQQLAPS